MPDSKKHGHVFKGFPLLDFLDPQAFNLDHILRTTALRTEIERHIKGVAVASDRRNGKCGCDEKKPASSARAFDSGAANPYAGAVATADDTAQSFEQQLEDFLDGLYLGCFESSVVQPDPQRPPQRYVYDIGFNTDKPTGFIVANPMDTLVTFGPRGPQASYTVMDPGVVRRPKMRNIKVRPIVSRPEGSTKPTGTHNTDFVTTFGATVGGRDRPGDEPRASIICDLNIRIVVNQRQELQQLSFYGDTMKVHLSKGLLEPVLRSVANEWVKTGKRLELGMGDRMITMRRNRLPTWGGPVDLGGATVSITSSNLFGALHKVDLGGTVEKPLIVFDGVEILPR
jgi:hypothetical protein